MLSCWNKPFPHDTHIPFHKSLLTLSFIHFLSFICYLGANIEILDLDSNLFDLHGLRPITGGESRAGTGTGSSQPNHREKTDRENQIHAIASVIGNLQRLVDLKLKDNRGEDMPSDLKEAVMKVCPGLRKGWSDVANNNNHHSNNNNNQRGVI